MSDSMIDPDLERDLHRHRAPLIGYCYRMLGSIHDAEDAVQDTMIRAWRALPRLSDPTGLKPWLYRIATNVCIDMTTARTRRALPVDLGPPGTAGTPMSIDTSRAWIEPAPDLMTLATADPADIALSNESVRLAFIVALQRLAPRQRAVLILRDVLRWSAADVAELLATSTDAVNSGLRRARTTIAEHGAVHGRDQAPSSELLAAYIDAFRRHDVDALVRILHDDAIVEMPPYDLWLRGVAEISTWLRETDSMSRHHPVPVRANGSTAIALYRQPDDGSIALPHAIHVLDVIDDRITAIHAFIQPTLFAVFGLATRLGEA
jgi:RNA polymerase sigma-70 factor, ECF subfamily